jgi:hypothetical protein
LTHFGKTIDNAGGRHREWSDDRHVSIFREHFRGGLIHRGEANFSLEIKSTERFQQNKVGASVVDCANDSIRDV